MVIDAESGNIKLVVEKKCYDDVMYLKYCIFVYLQISENFNIVLEVFSRLCCPNL